jgi:enamine deaminase RidA (YjgF/YER057c/UK114 family)
MIGTGRLARHLPLAHAATRPIERVLVWGRALDKAADGLRRSCGGKGCTRAGRIAARGVAQADIVSCATLSHEPCCVATGCARQHVDLVGPSRRPMRETDDAVSRRADADVVRHAGRRARRGRRPRAGDPQRRVRRARIAATSRRSAGTAARATRATSPSSIGRHGAEDLVAAACVRPSRAGALTMVQRYEIGKRMSQAVVHNGTVYSRRPGGRRPEPGHGPVRRGRCWPPIDKLLAAAGSDKSRILMAQIFLADMADFAAMNAVWDAWVAPGPCAGARDGAGGAGGAAGSVEIVVTSRGGVAAPRGPLRRLPCPRRATAPSARPTSVARRPGGAPSRGRSRGSLPGCARSRPPAQVAASGRQQLLDRRRYSPISARSVLRSSVRPKMSKAVPRRPFRRASTPKALRIHGPKGCLTSSPLSFFFAIAGGAR